MIFWDRKSDIDTIDKFLDRSENQSAKLILYQSKPAVGFTHFLKFIKYKKEQSAITFYIDGSNKINNSLFSQILITLGAEYHKRWVSYSKEVAGNKRGRMILAKVMEGVPYCGPLLQDLLDPNYLSPSFVYSAFPSAATELVSQFLRELSKENNIIIFIDNIQDIDSSSLDLISTTASSPYGNIKYVFGYISRSKINLRLNDFRDRISCLGHDVIETNFSPPDKEFTSIMALNYSSNIKHKDIQQAHILANGNIYKLLTEFQKLNLKNKIDEKVILQPLQKEILWYLSVGQQSLRKSDLYNLCTISPEIFIGSINDLDQCLLILQDRGIIRLLRIPGGDTLVELQRHSDPMTPIVSDDKIRLYLFSERLYEYFSKVSNMFSERHSYSEITPLLYRLSKHVAPAETHFRGKNVLKSVLSSGSIDAAINIYNEATIDSTPEEINDFILSIVVKMTIRQYKSALKIINSVPNSDWINLEIIQTLKAFCLNRCRDHKSSNELIDKLLKSTSSIEIKAMLISFKISGKIHDNDIKGAQEIFNKNKDKLKKSYNYGYFLRNSASSFKGNESIKLLLLALKYFKKSNNTFGAYTTLNNLGVNYFNLKEYKKALACFKKSQSGLEIYGIHHLHIVENNLGLCDIFSQCSDKSIYYFERSILFANKATMPIVYSKINMAFYYALTGNSLKAEQLLDTIRPQVENNSFNRMAQKYYLNASLILSYLDLSKSKIIELSRLSKIHPDRSRPERTIKAANFVEKFINNENKITRGQFMKLYSPCYLVYWYQNPLELLPDGVLPSYTISNDMFN